MPCTWVDEEQEMFSAENDKLIDEKIRVAIEYVRAVKNTWINSTSITSCHFALKERIGLIIFSYFASIVILVNQRNILTIGQRKQASCSCEA